MFAGGWTEVKRENMRIRSRTRMVVAAAAVLALVLSACGGDEAPTPEDDTPRTPARTRTPRLMRSDDEAAGGDSLIDPST
jgi:hypothetical protein